MADQKISELTALTGANVADDDAIAIVDTSATETKKIVFSELKNALDTATGFVRITGDTMTGALDVQSTITSDGLTVDGATQIDQLRLNDGYIRFQNATLQTPAGAAIYRPSGTSDLNIMLGSVNRAKFANGGDISFYEDTGTTPKFFWDASAESLGIGTSLPQAPLHVQANPTAEFSLWGGGGSFGRSKFNIQSVDDGGSTGKFQITTESTVPSSPELFTITNAGNVGIGTSSPDRVFHVSRSSASVISGKFESASTSGSQIVFVDADTTTNDLQVRIGSDANDLVQYAGGSERMRITSSGSVGIGRTPTSNLLEVADTIKLTNLGTSEGFIGFNTNGQKLSMTATDAVGAGMKFEVGASEAMRIDSSGNLLVSATTTSGFQSSSSESGTIAYAAGGIASNSPSNDVAGVFNRLGTDGIIVQLKKDGSTVGSIGVESGDLKIGHNTAALDFLSSESRIRPWNMSTNLPNDNAVDLGRSNTRFKDLYLSGGVYLGGTGSANKLDDYEEGTWTPTLPSGGTLTNNRSTYIKIGNKVTVTTYISSINPTANTSQFQIGGLPFTNVNTSNYYVGGSFGYVGQNDLSDVLVITGVNLDLVYFHENDGSASSFTNNEMRTKGLTGDSADAMIFTITYFT